YATSQIIAAAIDTIGVDEDDIIFSGRQAIDGDTAQVGPQIAEQLHVPQVSYVEDIKVEGNALVVKRQFEDQAHMLKVEMPCLLTALTELNEARYMSVGGIVDAYNKPVTVWGFDDLKDDLNPEFIGLKGSPTNVFQSFGKQLRAPGVVLNNLSADEAVEAIMKKLIERHII
ncbi:MAG: electron transfer flavoprotein subunit beta, partial [Oscillospiraceae bacterium]|nr:electron transfer flavoprotein subunit beta [Oscillospiraceae bacterium]